MARVEQSTLRVTAQPFVPKKEVPSETVRSPVKNKDTRNSEFTTPKSTPSKRYALRELSPEEIAAKAARSPLRKMKSFTPSSPVFDSPGPTRGARSCSKQHCKRCLYKERAFRVKGDEPKDTAKDGDTCETPARKENDLCPHTCGEELDSVVASLKMDHDESETVAPAETQGPQSPLSETSTLPEPSPSSLDVHAALQNPRGVPLDAKTHSAPEHTRRQQQLRVCLLFFIAVLLMLLLIQRNGLWKSTVRTVAAAGVALTTTVVLGSMSQHHK